MFISCPNRLLCCIDASLMLYSLALPSLYLNENVCTVAKTWNRKYTRWPKEVEVKGVGEVQVMTPYTPTKY